MSSARKRAARQKATNEADRLRQLLMLAEHHASMMESLAKVISAKCDATQAKLDELMLEYCPEDMTPEQLKNWERHQKAVVIPNA